MKLKEKDEIKREHDVDKALKHVIDAKVVLEWSIEKGYTPIEGNLDSSNPPRGGSGVPSTPPAGKEK